MRANDIMSEGLSSLDFTTFFSKEKTENPEISCEIPAHSKVVNLESIDEMTSRNSIVGSSKMRRLLLDIEG